MSYVDVKSVYGTTIKQYYIGASTDTKPTDVQIGARFIESDTQTTYIFSSDRTWVIDPEHQSLNKVWNADTLDWERMTQPLVNISNASLFVELASMDVQFQSMNTKLTSMVEDLDAGFAVNVASVTSAISYLTSVQASAEITLTAINAKLTDIGDYNDQMNNHLISHGINFDAMSTRVGNISTTLNTLSTTMGAISTRVGAISTTLNAISTIGGNISNVLSGISARLSIMSTAIGSINTLLASMELHFDPLAKFGIGFVDDTSATSYYGYQNRAGEWYVMRISNGSYLYYLNSANFDTGWGSRATLSYTSFAGVF